MIIKRIVYAGHSAAFLHADDFTIAIDPWLEGNPKCPSSLLNPKKLDLIVLTHGHSDHASDVLRLYKQNRGCRVAATFELATIIMRQGVSHDHVLPMNKGGTIEYKGAKITLTHAYHSSSYESEEGTLYAGEACGVVIRDAVRAIYHAGDTALFGDMSLIGQYHKPSIAFLPIGDRFTMGPIEAAHALKLIGADVAIPIHFATFPLLTGTADAFTAACSALPETANKRVVIMKPGDEFQID